MEKRGELLVSNIIFIVLNLLFLTILILFIAKQGGGAIILEQTTAKQIALLIDATQPQTGIELRVDALTEVAEENGIVPAQMIVVRDNVVTVKTTKKSGYSYSFFNDVDVQISFPLSKNEVWIEVKDYNE